MRVLHLFSNSKWTGPAEPALNLCVALRRIGVETDFACAPVSKAPVNKVVESARERGIEPVLRFRLNKHRNPLDNAHDRRALRRYLAEHPYDIIHCHLDNDHRIAVGPARKAGIPVIRSSYEGEGLRPPRLYSRVLRKTALLIEPSEMARDHDCRSYGLKAEHTPVIPGAVDTNRFDPGRGVPDGRQALGIAPEAFVVGIVARMQTHRRFEDFWEAIGRIRDGGTDVHVVVVGRGTKQAQVGMEPVRRLGLSDRVHFTGFIDGDAYVGMLKAFNVKVYLVPGSDGTCRAVREALAMGVPAIVADRGMLREIVQHGHTGYVCDGGPNSLARHILDLARDGEGLRKMGAAAREYALANYSLDVQARSIGAVYEMVYRRDRPPSGD